MPRLIAFWFQIKYWGAEYGIRSVSIDLLDTSAALSMLKYSGCEGCGGSSHSEAREHHNYQWSWKARSNRGHEFRDEGFHGIAVSGQEFYEAGGAGSLSAWIPNIIRVHIISWFSGSPPHQPWFVLWELGVYFQQDLVSKLIIFQAWAWFRYLFSFWEFLFKSSYPQYVVYITFDSLIMPFLDLE